MAIRSGISRERARRRRKFLFRLTLWVAGVGVFAAIGYSSYRTGSALAEREVTVQRAEIARLTAQVAADKMNAERLDAELTRMRQAAATLQQRYDADVPSGRLAALITILRQKQGAGINDDRIAQVLRQIDAPRTCADRVVRRRFPITTKPPGPDDVVSFLDGLIQISASMPASGDGPAKAAVVTISRAWAAEPIKVTGLPVQQVVMIYNTDMKLVVEASALSGYAEASLSTCGKG
jgi:hypothetical protein